MKDQAEMVWFDELAAAEESVDRACHKQEHKRQDISRKGREAWKLYCWKILELICVIDSKLPAVQESSSDSDSKDKDSDSEVFAK